MYRIARALMVVLFLGTASTVAANELEVVARLGGETPPGNIAVGPDGRIFLSVHGFYGQPVKVVELLPDGSTRPYPNDTWAFAPKDGGVGLYGVLGLNVDRNGILWLLDTSGEGQAGRLIGWDTRAEKLHRIIYLAAPVIRPGSFLNDLAIDADNGFVYIADTAGEGQAALIVVDLSTGQARRILEGSRYTVAEDIDMVIDGRTLELGGEPARLGVNPITLSPDNRWVYFGAMTGTSLYRVRGTDLRNATLKPEELGAKVERYGDKPISDGITVDGGGNVYITSITENAIGVVGPDGEYRRLFQRPDLAWPDGFAYGPDHKVYVTVNELHRSPVMNGGENGSRGELKVMRFDALAKGKVGR